MYLNATIHLPSSIKLNNLDKEVPIHVHIPSQKQDFLTIIENFPEIIIMPSVVITIVLLFKGYYYYHFFMDNRTIAKRIYLLEHKGFPCPYKRKLHDKAKFDHDLTFMWNHYMQEDYIYKTLLKAREFSRLIKEQMDLCFNLDALHEMPRYNCANDKTIIPNILTWAEFYKRKTRGQILIQYAFQLALKDKFSIFRLNRVDDILLAVEPESFLGAFWDRKTSSYVVIGQPDWWNKSMYAPGDKKKITYTYYKILDEDYRRAFISDDE